MSSAEIDGPSRPRLRHFALHPRQQEHAGDAAAPGGDEGGLDDRGLLVGVDEAVRGR